MAEPKTVFTPAQRDLLLSALDLREKSTKRLMASRGFPAAFQPELDEIARVRAILVS